LYVYPSSLPVFIPFDFLPKDGICIRFRHIDCYQVQFPPAAAIIPLCNDQAFPFQKFRRDCFAPPPYFLFIENMSSPPPVNKKFGNIEFSFQKMMLRLLCCFYYLAIQILLD
jgi:hypothetical protein